MSMKVDYLKNHFLNHIEFIEFESQINNAEFHIFGSSGALGLSLLELFSTIDFTPQSVILYGRNSSNLDAWHNWGAANNVRVCAIRADSLLDVDLTSITEKSTVVYLPGYAQPAKFMAKPGELFDLNITLLKRVIEKNPRHLFFSSTTEIYSGIDGKISEDSHTVTTPSHSRGAYIEAKRCAEALLAHFASKETKAVSFRIALATPPHHIPNDNRILSDIVSSALDTKQVKLRGGWDSIRQYQWGPVCLAKLIYAGFNGKNGLYNIAGGQNVTLEHLARTVADKLDATYIENNAQNEDIGAPQSVCISTELFDSEFSLKLPIENLGDLLDVYLSDARC